MDHVSDDPREQPRGRFRLPEPPPQKPLTEQFTLAKQLAEKRKADARDRGMEMPEPDPPDLNQLMPNRPRIVLPETEAKIRAKNRKKDGDQAQASWNQCKEPLRMLEALKVCMGRPFWMPQARFVEEFTRAAAWIFGDWNIAERLIPRSKLVPVGAIFARGNGEKTFEMLQVFSRFHRNPDFIAMAFAMTIRSLAPEAPPGWDVPDTGALGPESELGTF
jgi:hypothetical protein